MQVANVARNCARTPADASSEFPSSVPRERWIQRDCLTLRLATNSASREAAPRSNAQSSCTLMCFLKNCGMSLFKFTRTVFKVLLLVPHESVLYGKVGIVVGISGTRRCKIDNERLG